MDVEVNKAEKTGSTDIQDGGGVTAPPRSGPRLTHVCVLASTHTFITHLSSKRTGRYTFYVRRLIIRVCLRRRPRDSVPRCVSLCHLSSTSKQSPSFTVVHITTNRISCNTGLQLLLSFLLSRLMWVRTRPQAVTSDPIKLTQRL